MTYRANLETLGKSRPVIVSADKSPADLEGMEGSRSRLGWGLVADIRTTTYELRLGILQAKSEKVPIPVPKKVLKFLAHKITMPCSYPRSSQHDPCQKLGENLAGVITRLFCTESKKLRTS